MVEVMAINKLNIKIFYKNIVVIYFGNLLRYTYLNEFKKSGIRLIEFKIGKGNKIF